MTSIWVESLGRTFDTAFRLLEAAIRDCTDELWESSMWEVPVADAHKVHGPGGDLVTDPVSRHALAQRWSTRGAWPGTRSKSWTTTSPASSLRGRHRLP